MHTPPITLRATISRTPFPGQMPRGIFLKYKPEILKEKKRKEKEKKERQIFPEAASPRVSNKSHDHVVSIEATSSSPVIIVSR